jgi:hypothetical protein
MVTTRTTTSHTCCDRDHNDSNPSDHNCVSCHSFHLRAVVVTMSNSRAVITTTPMMGVHEDNNKQDKSHRDHDDSNTSDYD